MVGLLDISVSSGAGWGDRAGRGQAGTGSRVLMGDWGGAR